MNIISLEISPIFRPKLGEDQKKGVPPNLVRFFCAGQKQRVSPTICVLKFSPQLTKRKGGGAFRNFAY